MGNRAGCACLFRRRDDDNSLGALPTPHLRASTAKDTVNIGKLTIFSRKILGNGFFGTVFEGQWCQKPCAVKVLSPLGQEFLTGLPITRQNNVQEEALLKFKQECDFMKSYEHPNIVAYYNTVFYPGCNLPVLVMELMQTSLRKYIDEGAAMSMRIQVSLCCDIASALEFLHDRGLVHRDLCGDNVLLNYNQDIPIAKVSDFGISRIVKPEQLSHTLTALGHRPGYLPPEANNDMDPTDYDSSLDIFMFGVVMTQIANQVPTIHSSHERQELVSKLDRHSLKLFICQCLSENGKDRPSASTLYLDLHSVLESQRLKEECPSIHNASMLHQKYFEGNRRYQNEQIYQELEEQHDQTPPPPYPDYDWPNWPPDNHNNSFLPYPVQRVRSDSSSTNRIPNSISNSSRSNITSPNHSIHSINSSIKREESLHRSLLTPSPSGSRMQQSHSHQSIPTRSSASTPTGYQVLKKNYSSTLPHRMSAQYLSSSMGQIMKMRRHSSSSAYQTNLTQDGSGNLTMVTEV